jgi:hypothetical protein
LASAPAGAVTAPPSIDKPQKSGILGVWVKASRLERKAVFLILRRKPERKEEERREKT